MHIPRLSQLQSRLAATLTASIVIVALYFVVINPQFAYAADSIPPEDHNHLLLKELENFESQALDNSFDEGISRTYEPVFGGVDRSIVGRAPDDAPTALANNAAKNLNIKPGETNLYVFPKEALTAKKTPAPPGLPHFNGSNWRPNFADVEDEAKPDNDGKQPAKRQGGARPVYISLNTCEQPSPKGSTSGDIPPSLTIYVSKSASNKKPGPDAPGDQQVIKTADGGFAGLTIDASDDTFITVAAPSSNGFQDVYNYDLAASVDAPFHSYDPVHANLKPIDSDTNATLLMTANITNTTDFNDPVYKQWKNQSPPFILFANPSNDPMTRSLQNSYCAMKNFALVASFSGGKNAASVKTDMTSAYLPLAVKQQFYLENLNGSTTYTISLAMMGNSTVDGDGIIGGGGKVWKAFNVTTQSDGNCRVIYGLSFCSSVAYAVPGNPSFSPGGLAALYDNSTENMYKNFSKALAQIPCNTSSDAQYSLVKTCADCQTMYKSWLCAVTMPRCFDYSSQEPYLVPRTGDRNTLSSSRNPLINNQIKPGPYKELLPCKEHCWGMVQACPAKLSFGCPTGAELDRSYGSDGLCNALDGLVTSKGSNKYAKKGWKQLGVVTFATTISILYL
ncbi:MAG: hypothetical protein M4579_006983 [Chaenotheca gracillima]|nr:MAG: hypothetical protein M4579_006983 [Chaenotheca gracillima]